MLDIVLASPLIATDTGAAQPLEAAVTGRETPRADEATMQKKQRHRCGSQRIWPIKNPTLRLKT